LLKVGKLRNNKIIIMKKLTKNFSISEFSCRCGCTMPSGVLLNIERLAVELQLLRTRCGASITINSAYRCKAHNKSVGGAKSSQHLLGKAADIVIKGFTPDEVVNIVYDMLENPFLEGMYVGGVGRYNSFTHLDIRELREHSITLWDNRTSINK